MGGKKTNALDLAYSLTTKNNQAIGNHSFAQKLREKTYANKLYETATGCIVKKPMSPSLSMNSPISLSPTHISLLKPEPQQAAKSQNQFFELRSPDKTNESPFHLTNEIVNNLEKTLFKKFYINFTKDHPGRAIDMLKNDIVKKEKVNKGFIEAGMAVNLEVQDY